ncbi:MAG: hypothetical protein DCF16_04590 [Alphaproteobacteria bacterium]|nr:MAG: hypothetical protein DCF16_04590 [Alphaproteobacteria bacterium]
MNRTLALVLYGIGLALISHFAIVFAAPYLATDVVIARIDKVRALTPNELRVAPPTSPPRDLVPMGNADTITASSWLDLRQGPLLFEAPLPRRGEYWSVSIFAHDSDTDFIMSDRDVQAGEPARVLIYGPGQVPPIQSDAIIARVSTERAFLLVRAIMRDRNDNADVEALSAELRQATLRPAP